MARADAIVNTSFTGVLDARLTAGSPVLEADIETLHEDGNFLSMAHLGRQVFSWSPVKDTSTLESDVTDTTATSLTFIPGSSSSFGNGQPSIKRTAGSFGTGWEGKQVFACQYPGGTAKYTSGTNKGMYTVVAVDSDSSANDSLVLDRRDSLTSEGPVNDYELACVHKGTCWAEVNAPASSETNEILRCVAKLQVPHSDSSYYRFRVIATVRYWMHSSVPSDSNNRFRVGATAIPSAGYLGTSYDSGALNTSTGLQMVSGYLVVPALDTEYQLAALWYSTSGTAEAHLSIERLSIYELPDNDL